MSAGKSARISIMLVDDHPLLRQALRAVLDREDDLEVVAEAGDGAQAVALATEMRPDVVIMDISLPEMDGVEATRRLKEVSPGTAVLALTVHDDEQTIAEVLSAGASGYLTKSVFDDEVVQAVRALAAGDMVLSPSVGQALLRQVARHTSRSLPLNSGEKLTARELEVLRLIARGMSNNDIATTLGLRLRTVKGYVTDIFAKLGVSTRTEAVAFSLQAGIISVDDIR